MVGDLTSSASYKTMLGRMCLGAMLLGQQLTKSSHHSMSYVPILSILLSSVTLVWLLSVVAYGDSSTMSQAEGPLEQIHAFYWEMGPMSFLSPNHYLYNILNNK